MYGRMPETLDVFTSCYDYDYDAPNTGSI